MGAKANPDGAHVCLALARFLRRSIGDVVAADEAHERELSELGTARIARDEEFLLVRCSMSSLRAIIEGAYGAEALPLAMMGSRARTT